MLEAIFFDQDNTLINTKDISGEAYRAGSDYLAKETQKDPQIFWENWRKIVDELKSSKEPQKRSLEYSWTLMVKNETLVEEAVKKFEEVLEKKLELKTGVEEFFEGLKMAKKYILVTEDFKKHVEIKMKKFDLKKKFDFIVDNSIVSSMKPDISYYKIAWEKFNLDPKKCLYIGDNYDKDCRIGVENGGKALVFGVDFTDFRQLGELLKNY